MEFFYSPPFLPTFRCSHPQDLIHNFLLANRAYIFLSYVLIYKSLRNGDVLRRFLADPHQIHAEFTLPDAMHVIARAVGIIYHFDSQREIVYKSLSTDYESYAF